MWGSPELEHDKTIEIALPKRKPVKMTMHAVRRGNGKPAATPAPAPAPDPDDLVDDDTHDGNGHDAHTGEVYERDDSNPF